MERPTSVSAFGILNTAKGLLGIVATFWGIVIVSSADAANIPILRIMLENEAYMTWLRVTTPLALIASGALLATGIGLWHLKSWARKLSIAWGLYAILFVILNTTINCTLLLRPMLDEAHRMHGPEGTAMIFGSIGGTFGGAIGLIYPIVLLFFMTRPKVVSAFQMPPPLPMAR